jgi:hypothetical protein
MPLQSQHLNSTGIASLLVMSKLLRALESKGILTTEDAAAVLAGAIRDLEGDDRSLIKGARDLLEELHSTWVGRTRA